MYVWNIKCRDYPPGFTTIPDDIARKLIKKGEVQDPRIGALHMSKPEFSRTDYLQKVVEPASTKTTKKKKKVTRKKAKK